MNIKELQKEAHKTAIEKGFYDCTCDGGSGYIVTAGGTYKCKKCENGKTNRNIGELLALAIGEAMEALEAHRCDRFADINMYEDILNRSELWHNHCFTVRDEKQMIFEKKIQDTFESEIADIYIRLFDFFEYKEIDIKINDIKYNIPDNVGHSLLQITGSIYRMIECDGILDINCEASRAITYLNQFCQKHKIDIETHIKLKMAYNKTRPHKHGKKY